MSPRARVRVALVLLVLSIVGWPLSAFWFAKEEPPVVLALSWLAITLTCADIVVSTDVRKQQENDG